LLKRAPSRGIYVGLVVRLNDDPLVSRLGSLPAALFGSFHRGLLSRLAKDVPAGVHRVLPEG